ncbi:chitosanase [Streptomyces niveus]|uniref:chitosanase n=1 Tax=Streptomyces niveus TaxID=193462 RepID=UPI0033D018CD
MIEQFYGPDGVDVLWVDFGVQRVVLVPMDTSTRLTQHTTADDPHGDRAFVTTKLAVPGGIATLGSNGQVLSSQLPSSLGEGSLVSYTLTANQTIPLPTSGTIDGRVVRVFVLASGADRTATFHTDYRLSSTVTSRAFVVPSGQVLVVTAIYSTLAQSWILTSSTTTSGAGTTPPDPGAGQRPTISAGSAATILTTATFGRTATENANGSPITNRDWSIVSGPMGQGTSIGNAAALSWRPGSSPTNTVDIRQPICMEMAFQLTSTAENGTTSWDTQYRYIEDIGDDRGYTAGIVGFTSATGDMLSLVQDYIAAKPGNGLAGYLTGLQNCYAVGFGPGAAAAAASNLGAPFFTAWRTAADTDPVFRQVQREFRKTHYWNDALTQALADGVSPLGLALHYDILINHGPGTDSQSYGGIIAAARASATKPPSQGGSESAYLLTLCDLRDAVLQAWGDYQVNGRSSMFKSLINTGKFSLTGLISWSIYGSPYSFERPEPKEDARSGKYTLRYTATNAYGTSTSDVILTAELDSSASYTVLSTLTDDFSAASINTTKWPNFYPTTGTGAPTLVGGRARIPCTTSYSGLKSASIYTLAGSSGYCRVYPPAVSGATTNAYVSVNFGSATTPEGTAVGVNIDTMTGKIRFSMNVDYWDNNAVSLTYNSTTHAWVRVREAAGQLYWETSSDGTAWAIQRQVATPSWVASAHDVFATIESHRNNGTVNYAEIDNFNVAP